MEKARLLLVDDHAVVRAGIRNALESLNFVEIVGEGDNGRSLLTTLKTLQPDLLLIDLTMPDFDPISSIRTVREAFPTLKILVVSAYDDDVYVQGLLGAGVNGYHLKDQPLSDLRLAVERVLMGERWLSSSLVEKLLTPQPTAVSPPPSIPQTSPLSLRQQQILRLLVNGLDNRSIAQQLSLSVKTVENHLTRIYRQLKVQSRLEAVNVVHDNPNLINQANTPHESSTKTAVLPVHLPTQATTILIVDDNERYRHQLSRLVQKAHPTARIIAAHNIFSAVALTKQVQPQLVFTDVVLGDESGIRCVRRLKAIQPDLRAILITAYPDREFHRQGLAAGAIALLDKKDLNVAALRQMIADALDS